MKTQRLQHGKPKQKKPWWKRVLFWTGISLASVLGLVICGFLVVFYTPFFTTTRDKYILMTYHTSNPWLATAFFSDETIAQVLEENKVVAPEGSTNPDLIRPGGAASSSQPAGPSQTEPTGTHTATNPTGQTSASSAVTTPAPTPPPTLPSSTAFETEVLYEEEGLDILKIQGDTYVARLIRVADPSRVFLGVTSKLMKFGEKLPTICKNNNALAGINAGGFDDPNGGGNGGTPSRLLVKDYEILFCDGSEKHAVIGFNEDNVLILGEFTDEEILEMRIRDAVSFGPFVILNREKATVRGMAGGYDPRTAIGQTADGTVLLLVIDGRQPGIEGGNMKTVMDIMWEYGAVNAANLDGGSSATMVLNDTIINSPCSLYGPRYLPNGWLVKRAQ